MQNSIQIFEKEMLGSIRVLGDFENPLFCLSDVCKILEIQNVTDIKRAIEKEFDEGGRLNLYPLQTAGGVQNFTFISEPQLYFVLMRSDKPKAKSFRQWVINGILPQIRKQGVYSPNKYISELASLLMQNLPPNDYTVRISINDFNAEKELHFAYSVGDKQQPLNTKFVPNERLEKNEN